MLEKKEKKLSPINSPLELHLVISFHLNRNWRLQAHLPRHSLFCQFNTALGQETLPSSPWFPCDASALEISFIPLLGNIKGRGEKGRAICISSFSPTLSPYSVLYTIGSAMNSHCIHMSRPEVLLCWGSMSLQQANSPSFLFCFLVF